MLYPGCKLRSPATRHGHTSAPATTVGTCIQLISRLHNIRDMSLFSYVGGTDLFGKGCSRYISVCVCVSGGCYGELICRFKKCVGLYQINKTLQVFSEDCFGSRTPESNMIHTESLQLYICTGQQLLYAIIVYYQMIRSICFENCRLIRQLVRQETACKSSNQKMRRD